MRKPYSLYKRRTGITEKKKDRYCYYVAFWDPAAKRYIRRATGQTSEAAADALARKWLADGIVRSTENLYDYIAGFWAADGAYARYRRLQGRPLSSGYLTDMNIVVNGHVLPWLEDPRRRQVRIAEVTPELLEGLVLHLAEKGLSPRRVNAVRQAVSVALSEAKRLGKIRHNPMADVLKLAEPRPRREVLTLEEARAVLGGKWTDERYRLINMLAASTGMRMGECRGLQAEDLVQDGEVWCIVVRHNWQDGEGLKEPKWGSTRAVPLPPVIARELQDLYTRNPWQNGFIFPGCREDVPIGKHTVSDAFNAAIRRAGISEAERRRRRLTFHSWRHWYVTYIRERIPAYAVQALTRHQTERMLDQYTTVTEEQRRAVRELVERILPER